VASDYCAVHGLAFYKGFDMQGDVLDFTFHDVEPTPRLKAARDCDSDVPPRSYIRSWAKISFPIYPIFPFHSLSLLQAFVLYTFLHFQLGTD
jgi:hypothetical protein